jgi:hypothetical protein
VPLALMSRPVVVLILTLVSCSISAGVHLLMSAQLFLWHAVHDGYLGDAPPGRLQVYGFFVSAVPAAFAKDVSPREKISKA